MIKYRLEVLEDFCANDGYEFFLNKFYLWNLKNSKGANGWIINASKAWKENTENGKHIFIKEIEFAGKITVKLEWLYLKCEKCQNIFWEICS